MRIGEAVALDRDDVELSERRLTVRHDKSGRSREVALHPSTVTALDAYARVRDELCPHPKDPELPDHHHRRATEQGHHLARVRPAPPRHCGLDHETLGRQPAFTTSAIPLCCARCLSWYREDADVEAQLPLLSTFLGHVHPSDTYWYFEGAPELLALAAERLERTWERALMTPLRRCLQAFFTERLARQRDASPHTIAAYRDSFRLLLAFVHEQTGKSPSKLELEDLDAARIAAFLGHLEHDRGNSVRTRNARLTAIHSFFHYAALRAPEQAELIARVLAIPEKRFDTTLISYLTEPEIDALLAAPDRSTWTGRRDHALLLLAVQTGLRASELASLRRQDLQLDSPAWVRCRGKGRKERCTPLSRLDQAGTARLAARTRRPPRQPAVPQPQRSAPHPRRDLATRRQTRRHRHRPVPLARLQEHHPAHPPSHHRDAAAARAYPDRHRDDRAVARPRNPRHHQQVHPRRHGTQTTRAGPHRTPEHEARPLPATRPATRIPREPLTRPKYVQPTSPIPAQPQHIPTARNIVPGAT